MDVAIERRFNTRIAREIKTIESRRGQFVTLVALRRALFSLGVPVEAQDVHFRRMSKAGLLHFAPNSDRKNLTPEDHRDAIVLGGEPKHLVALDSALWES